MTLYQKKYLYESLPKFNYEKGITKFDGETYNLDFYSDTNEGIILCEKSKKIKTMSLTIKETSSGYML